MSDQAEFLVVTKSHLLLPYSHRLANLEKLPTRTVVWRASYETAWEPLVKLSLVASHKELHRGNTEPLVAATQAGELVVLTDLDPSTGMGEALRGPLVYGRASCAPTKAFARLGGWACHTGEGLTLASRHLVIFDMGVWPGGMGMQLPGACTIIMLDEADEDAERLFDELAMAVLPQGFQGLFNLGIEEDGNHLKVVGGELGWPFLQTQTFLWDLENAHTGSSLLNRAPLSPRYRFTVGIPVSIPPWPVDHQGVRSTSVAGTRIGGLNPRNTENFTWHDIRMGGGGELQISGTDGLICVAHGGADSFELALKRALLGAAKLEVPEKQFRMDAGQLVRPTLLSLEERFNLFV